VILPDVNVLIYAYRPDSVDHDRYKQWLEDVVNGPSAYGISPQVVGSVVRICTHAQVFAVPDRCEDVLRFGRVLLEQPNATIIVPGARHWSVFESLCLAAKATGNLVQDAWFAALAMEAGCEWITTDRDYARFPGLRWRPPFQQQ
jgi:uncharacterized protein